MVLDPFTAIGLASNIVQFVDYSSKLMTSTCEIYKSRTGTSAHHVYLEGIATRLLNLSDSLEQPRLSCPNSYDKGLQHLRAECVQDAEALRSVLRALQAKKDSKWSSFRKALISAWGQEEIERLEDRLKDHRSELSTHLTAMMR